jgi:hypothetical protein
MYHPLLYQGRAVCARGIGDLLEIVLGETSGKVWLDLRSSTKNEKIARELGMKYVTEGSCDVLCTLFTKEKPFTDLGQGWRQLRPGGHLIVIMDDSSEPTNLWIEKFLDPVSWEGVVTVKHTKKKTYPAWIWTKSEKRNRWNPGVPRSLGKLYPAIAGGIFRAQAAHLTPLYTQRMALLEELRSSHPELSDLIRTNKIMVTSLIEECGVETTLRYLNGAPSESSSLCSSLSRSQDSSLFSHS